MAAADAIFRWKAKAHEDVALHFDLTTDATHLVMGDHMHFGYFARPDDPLGKATVAMVDLAVAQCNITKDMHVLDVGCGSGRAAIHLHEKFGCSVTGISTSARGIDLARENTKGRGDALKFVVADAVSTGLQSQSVDVVFIMETAFYLPDLRALMVESLRVLRPGGTLIISDPVAKRSLPGHFAFMFKNGPRLLSMKHAWGPGTYMRNPGTYVMHCLEAGFRHVELTDLSEHVKPTTDRWKERALAVRETLEQTSAGKSVLRTFTTGSEHLRFCFDQGFFGYMHLMGKRPE